jgi:hypothetical protein
MLYVGTSKPLPRKRWDKAFPDISVESLTERDDPIRTFFSSPEVQYVGSTSCCGCDFPNVIYQNGGWPICEDELIEGEQDSSYRYNREALVKLLRSTGEAVIEIYGVWAGKPVAEPCIREEIFPGRILDSDFYFKERGFLKVML